MKFIDCVDHGMHVCRIANITCLNFGSATCISESELSFVSGTDSKKADQSKAEWPLEIMEGLVSIYANYQR